MIDPVWNSDPSHQRAQPDAARYDENEGFLIKCLQHAAQPTQKLVDAPLVAVTIEHALEEDGQFVNDQKHRLLVGGAIAQQLFSVTPSSFRHPTRHGFSR